MDTTAERLTVDAFLSRLRPGGRPELVDGVVRPMTPTTGGDPHGRARAAAAPGPGATRLRWARAGGVRVGGAGRGSRVRSERTIS